MSRFWFDNWVGVGPLYVLFPKVLSGVQHKVVHEIVLLVRGEVVSFRRPMREFNEIQSREEFTSNISFCKDLKGLSHWKTFAFEGILDKRAFQVLFLWRWGILDKGGEFSSLDKSWPEPWRWEMFHGCGLFLWRIIPYGILWSIWKERNSRVFKSASSSLGRYHIGDEHKDHRVCFGKGVY